MKLTYTNVNGYLIPNLTYKSGEQMEQLGKYGFLRRNYLKQEEIRKLNSEIQLQTIEFSETQKLNRSLQQSNDDLRNRNGLMSRSEQEQLEEEIKDVRNRNSKLQIQVNQLSVEAIEQAQQKQEDAERWAKQAEYQAEREKKRAEVEIQKARRKAKSEIDDMKERQFFWNWGYFCVIFFSFIQNGAFQRDLLQFIMLPINWCREYVTWFEQLDYLGYSAGEVAFERIFSMAVIMAEIVGCVFFFRIYLKYKYPQISLYKE